MNKQDNAAKTILTLLKALRAMERIGMPYYGTDQVTGKTFDSIARSAIAKATSAAKMRRHKVRAQVAA